MLSSTLFHSKKTLCGFRKILNVNNLCYIITFDCQFCISSLTPISYNMHVCNKITRMQVNEAHIQFLSSVVPIMSMNVNIKMIQHWTCGYNNAVNLKVGDGSKTWKVLTAYKYTGTPSDNQLHQSLVQNWCLRKTNCVNPEEINTASLQNVALYPILSRFTARDNFIAVILESFK